MSNVSPKRFRDYILLREVDEKQDTSTHAEGLQTTMVLGKNNDFKPFVVTDDSRNPAFPSNKNLAPIIQAFTDSKKVKVYNSMGKGGEPKPHTLPQKRLYMVGGAVRDHLMGKTPHDVDLATDATPDEIRMILSDNGFKELDKDRSGPGGKKVFYVNGKDKAGTDFVFGAKVGGQEFEIATFRKDGHGSDRKHPDAMSFGGHADDSSRRDLTINSMYILLSNPDGPNNQLTDFHGGVYDLKAGKVKFVGNPDDRLEEDLLRALRYARFAARFGKGDIDPEIEKAIAKVAHKIASVVSPERIQQEFVKGLDNDDTDPAKLVYIYKKLGLLDVVFPGLSIKLDGPEDYPKNRDRAIVVASLLRGNHPGAIQQSLHRGKWKNEDIARVGFLHKILQLNPGTTPEELEGHLNGYNKSGIMGSSLKDWWGQNKGGPGILDAFLDFAKEPRVKTIVMDDETGDSKLHPDFAPMFDPISMSSLPGMGPEVGALKRSKEHHNFAELLRQHIPRQGD